MLPPKPTYILMTRRTLSILRQTKDALDMMLTPDTLAQLSPQDRYARLDAEAVAHYGTERWKAQLSRDFAVARSTVTFWKQNPHVIPAGVILALAAWNFHKAKLAQLREQLTPAAPD